MYAKVFKQILSSSIAEDYLVRLVFEDFLILADPDGTVDMTAESIARHTNVPLEIVQRGIESLSQPDLKSRTSDHDGRRLILINDHREWGWKIVNYSLYAAIRTNEERRSYMSNYMAKRRSAAHACKQPVNSVNSSLAELANEDVDVPVSGNGKEQTLLSGKPDEIVSNSHSVRKNLTPLELVVSGSCKEKKRRANSFTQSVNKCRTWARMLFIRHIRESKENRLR